MSSGSDLGAMFSALDEGDLDTARRRAHNIRKSTRQPPKRPSGEPPRVEPAESSVAVTAHILTRLAAGPRLVDVCLPSATRDVLNILIREQTRVELLASHGLAPRRRILFVGPPGVGKSMTAQALAHELGWPAYVTRIDSLVRSHLGQTASRVRELFGFAASTRAVLLLDEVDAIARRRGVTSDVGEIDRVVVTLLQELEHSHPAGLLIATSNLPDQLDDALWRRFDLVVRFARPTRKQLVAFARVEARKRAVPFRALRALQETTSYADVARLVADAQRERLLGE